MQCIINDETFTFEEDLTVSQLLAHMDIDADRVVVEHNGELIKKESFDSHIVKSDDRLELLEFVGGG
ncbi:sulfur carrier protein ThiS [Lacicoccus alkaliphilus]|uniref:Sulfur carrier protein n=1 Tax=Lacicoccus alkaliphilus DSM 16010 TaxID=1123231 RepID=A0A1M7ITX5_9BACL|nr:sulfur carrier protein ThiS [Salinicoccus alkaliphilus]SHM44190.1 sulfur carrier protein [Salinicoccus alkaliphilus DSM 16010]